MRKIILLALTAILSLSLMTGCRRNTGTDTTGATNNTNTTTVPQSSATTGTVPSTAPSTVPSGTASSAPSTSTATEATLLPEGTMESGATESAPRARHRLPPKY